jgi:hypothetical protein
MSLPCAVRLLLSMVNQCLVVRSQTIQSRKRYDYYLVILTSTKQASMSGQHSLTFAGMTQFDEQEAPRAARIGNAGHI